MRPHADAGMSLYGPTGGRKYLNAAPCIPANDENMAVRQSAC
jgi:hypothetical protein